jgi:hypothetical protein
LQNHFSCIFWSSPLSASFNIAVDMSSARGESLWKAWYISLQNKSENVTNKYIVTKNN